MLISLVFIVVFTGTQRTFAKPIIFSQQALGKAMTIQKTNEIDLMSRPGVQGVGIGAKGSEPAIVILVNEENQDAQLPTELNGLPVIIKKVEKFVAEQINLGVAGGNNILCEGAVSTCDDSGNPNAACLSDGDCPLDQSCEVSFSDFCDVGTVGFKVCDNINQGTVGFLMNNHVAASGCPGKCPNNAPLGTDIYSPGFQTGCSTLGAQAGTLSRFAAIRLDGGNTFNDVDAAFIQSSDEQVSCTIQGLGEQRNVITFPAVGLNVCKSGAVTGVTCGEITEINLTLQVEYFRTGIPSTEPCGTGNGWFRNTFRYSPIPPYTNMSSGGDSGAPVVTADNNNAVGLHFAGGVSDGVAIPIGSVLDTLNVSLCCSTTTTTAPPVCTADEDCEDDGIYCNGDEICDEDSGSCVSTGNPCAEDERCIEQSDLCQPPGIEVSTNAVGSGIFLLPGVLTIQGMGTNFTRLGSIVTYDPPVLFNYFKLVNPNTQAITQFVIVMPSILGIVPSYPATVTVTVDDFSDDMEIGKFLF